MQSTLKLLRRIAVSATALAAVGIPSVATVGPGVASASSVAKTALIDGETVTFDDGIKKGEEPISLEQFAAENAGYSVTVKSAAEWKATTAEEFAKYQVLIVGDPDCGGQAVSAIESADTWAPVVMGSAGNRVVVGTDPEDHYQGGAEPTNPADPTTSGAEHLVQDGITYAGGVEGATGVYFDTHCQNPPEDEEMVKVFDKLSTTGSGWEASTNPPCGGNVKQIAEVAAFNSGPTKLQDSDIQGWGCSVHVTFPAFPTDWHALAVAIDTETTPTCGIDPGTEELACGQAYVLLAGRGIVAKSNLVLTPASHEDPAGGEHTVTATLTDKKEPAVGIAVSFVVTEQNAGATGTCTTTGGAADPECKTDETGGVRFTYKDVNGAGHDTINASATLEHEVEVNENPGESVRAAAVVRQAITEQATATETWTPVVVIPTPAPTQKPVVTEPVVAVLAAKEVAPAKGTARTASVHSCIASSGYLASVHGSSIASVTFTLDGHKIKTLTKPTSTGTFALHVKLRPGVAHHLSMHVVFTASSKTPATTLRKTLARCAAVHRSLPVFTG